MTDHTDHPAADVPEPAEPALPRIRLLQRKLAVQPVEQRVPVAADNEDWSAEDGVPFEDDKAALDAAMDALEAEETQDRDAEETALHRPD